LLAGVLDLGAVLGHIVRSEGGVRGLETRVGEMQNALQVFLKSPILGVGLGYKMPPLFAVETNLYIPDLYIVHNFYLYVLAKFGLLGVPIFAGFLISAVRLPMKLYRATASAFEKALCAGVASMVVALLVESFTAPRFTDKTSNMILAICLSMVLSLQKLGPSPETPQAKATSVSPRVEGDNPLARRLKHNLVFDLLFSIAIAALGALCLIGVVHLSS
jgi:O-antigen ligase